MIFKMSDALFAFGIAQPDISRVALVHIRANIKNLIQFEKGCSKRKAD
jgi:hypothetical protein